jgi:hypothetical protein
MGTHVFHPSLALLIEGRRPERQREAGLSRQAGTPIIAAIVTFHSMFLDGLASVADWLAAVVSIERWEIPSPGLSLRGRGIMLAPAE